MSPQRQPHGGRPLDAVLHSVPSKSVTHRALVIAALASGRSFVRGALDADDTRVTRRGLRALGIAVETVPGGWTVAGCGGRVRGGGALSLADSGTSCRLLLGVAALGAEPSRLDGSARLRERPLAGLVAALRVLGARVEGSRGDGLPLRAGGSSPRGGVVALSAGESSQFASALLLIGSCLPAGVDVTLKPPAVSLPYVKLTAGVMSAFGVPVRQSGVSRWTVRPGAYPGRDYTVEGDHSSASYFLAAPAITGGRVRVEGLPMRTLQPDHRLGAVLERLGCRVIRGDDWVEVQGGSALPGFDLELTDVPDLVPTLAVLGMFATGPSRLRGVGHLRLKESDRLRILAENLCALGCPARTTKDRLEIEPTGASLRGGTIATAGDHRIAMAFAVAGLRIDGIELDDPACVGKSNPGFWSQYEQLRGQRG